MHRVACPLPPSQKPRPHRPAEWPPEWKTAPVAEQPEAAWVCRAALKPGEPSTPQLRQGTHLSRTTESGKLMPILSISRANTKAGETAALWRELCTPPLFAQPVKSEQLRLVRGLTMPFCAAGAQPGPPSPGGWMSAGWPHCSSPIQEQKGKGLGSGARELQLHP